MCGIFALIQPQLPVQLSEIKSACSLLQHRGPDQSGYALFLNGRVGFGHNRLAIQDPNAPPQPLVDQRTGTAIIFNGEVYDHVEIGRTLTEKHNIILTDGTDTAVILALYTLHGPTPEFFAHLNGEFSFVIWDPRRKCIFSMRDRFGVKPLYWYYDNVRLAFASEIKAIASLNGFKRKFSKEWLDRVDCGTNVPQHLTFMDNIYSLLPGHYMSMDLSSDHWRRPQITEYWSPIPFLQAPSLPVSYEDAKAEVRRLLTKAVKRRLVADREVCVYLSGGVDSTIVCGLVRSLGHPLTCITISLGKDVLSEEDIAKKTASYYSLPHKCVDFTLSDTALELEKTVYHTEFLVVNPSSVAKFHLSKAARENGFAVSLTGEGSDEILLGYSPFRLEHLLDLRSRGGEIAKNVETRWRNLLGREVDSFISVSHIPKEIPRVRGVPCWQAGYVHDLHVFADGMRADVHSLPTRSLDDFAPTAPEGFSGLRLTQVDWFGRLHNYIIPCMGDRVEMAFSIEGRPPFLDTSFTEYALRLPQEYLLDPDTLREKKILYEAFEDLLPPHMRQRKKQPFLAPGFYETLTLTKEGQELKEKHLSCSSIERVGVWSHPKVEEMLKAMNNGRRDLDGNLGLVLSIQILHYLFIEGNLEGDPEFPMTDTCPTVIE